MNRKTFFDNLMHITQEDIIDSHYVFDIFSVQISPKDLIRFLTILKDHKQLRLEQLIDIVAIDYPKRKNRFEIIYHLMSYEYNQRLFVRVCIDEDKPLSTITNIFLNASWYEREVFDLMGISFADHPDLRRLLTDYNFNGHPLRKDFPLSGYVQIHYDEKRQKVDYEPVNLEQNYRNFDTLSPWEGILQKKK